MTLLDKAKEGLFGVFGTSEAEPSHEQMNTPEEEKIVSLVETDYQVAKESRHQVEPTWKEEQRIYAGEHWHGLREKDEILDRPSNVDNIAWAVIESIIGKIVGWDPFPDFEAQEEGDEQKSQDLNDFIPHELRKIGFRAKFTKAIRTCVTHGPLILQTIFDPSVEGGRGLGKYDGQNDIIPVDLGSFFPDPRISDFIYLQKMGFIIVNTRQTEAYFKQRWPKKAKHFMEDSDANETMIHNNYSDAIQAKTAGLMEYWYRGLPKMVSSEDKKLFEELADKLKSEGKDPKEALAKADGTTEGVHCIYQTSGGLFLEHKAYVYDHGRYPFSARTLYPIADSLWGKGFMRDMIQPQRMLNKFTELALETMSKQGTGGVMYEESAMNRNHVRSYMENRSQAGPMMQVADGAISQGRIKEFQGIDVPATVFNMIQHCLDMLQKIPGQFDSANGQASSNVTSGEQAKALISAASTRLNPITDAIQEALEEVFSQYIELIAQFYTTERVARVTGRKVSMSRDALVNSVPTQLEFETGEIEEFQEEYVPTFDIRVNIAADKPVDREYWVQTANNLIQVIDPRTGMPMIDTEALMYTIQHGRMEPYSTIKKRMDTDMQIQQQMQELQQQNEQLMAQVQASEQQIQQVTTEQQQVDQDDKLFDQSMQEQKMRLETAKVAGDLYTKAESNNNAKKV